MKNNAPAQPNIVISNNQQVVGGGAGGKSDADAALMIFIIGWFCPLCVWIIGGIMYCRSTDPSARMWSMISIICGSVELVGLIIIIAVVASAASAVSDCINNPYSSSCNGGRVFIG